MSDALVFECELDASPEKVWRALTIPQYLARWLKLDETKAIESGKESIDFSVISAEENTSISYRLREAGAGQITGTSDSIVTFELSPTEAGGTWFRLTHSPPALLVAANNNQGQAATLLAA
jgi:uncharacterized protein YndB with AHSA1/START domain